MGENININSWGSAVISYDRFELFDIGQAPVTISAIIIIAGIEQGIVPHDSIGRTARAGIGISIIIMIAGTLAPHKAGSGIGYGAIAMDYVAAIGPIIIDVIEDIPGR